MKLFLFLGLPFLTRWEEPHPVRQEESVIVRRWVYPSAGPESGEDLHNKAVDAERSGNLEAALDFSRESYVKRPRRRGMVYIERLEERIADQNTVAERIF